MFTRGRESFDDAAAALIVTHGQFRRHDHSKFPRCLFIDVIGEEPVFSEPSALASKLHRASSHSLCVMSSRLIGISHISGVTIVEAFRSNIMYWTNQSRGHMIMRLYISSLSAGIIYYLHTYTKTEINPI